MPQIKEYQQQVEPNAASPSKRVYPDAFEAFPRNAGAGAMALGEVLQQEQEKDDTSNVHVMMAQARADWTNHLTESYQRAQTSVSMTPGEAGAEGAPNQSTPMVSVGNFADQYMGDLSTYLTDAKQNVKTQNGSRLYDALATNLHADLQEKSFQAQAHLTGLKAVADYNNALNNYRNTLLSDPSQFDSVLKEASTGLGSWVDIPAAERIKLMEQTSEKLALSAVQGWIKTDPQGTLKQLNEGQWDTYLTGNGKYMLMHQAQLAINAQEVEAGRIARAQDALEKKVRTQVNDGFMEKFLTGDLSMKEVMQSSLLPFGEGSKETWRTLIEKQNADGLKPVKTDPAWFQKTFADIHRSEGDPDKIVDENTLNAGFINGMVNRTDLAFLRKEVQDDRTPAGQRLNETKTAYFHSLKNAFDRSIPGLTSDPVGPQKLFDFMQFVESRIAETRRNQGNVYDLFNKNSKDFVGQYLPQFLPTLNDRVRTMQDAIERGDVQPATSQRPPPPTDPNFDYRWDEQQQTWQRKRK